MPVFFKYSLTFYYFPKSLFFLFLLINYTFDSFYSYFVLFCEKKNCPDFGKEFERRGGGGYRNKKIYKHL